MGILLYYVYRLIKGVNMFVTETEHKSAGNYAWIAARDARMRSVVNSSLFSDTQKIKAERAKLALELCYYSKAIHIEYRKKFISVKVDGAQVRDRKGLALLEQCYQTDGYEKCITNPGITYRIYR